MAAIALLKRATVHFQAAAVFLTEVTTWTAVFMAIVGKAGTSIVVAPAMTVVVLTTVVITVTNLNHPRSAATTTVLRFTVAVMVIAPGALGAGLVAAPGDATILILITMFMGLTVIVTLTARAMLWPTSLQFTEALPPLRANAESAMTNGAVVVSLAT